MIFAKDNGMFQVQESTIMHTDTLVTGTTSSDLDSIPMFRLTDLVQQVSLQQASVLLLCLKPVCSQKPDKLVSVIL